jgi:hypothetical protein
MHTALAEFYGFLRYELSDGIVSRPLTGTNNTEQCFLVLITGERKVEAA